MILFYFDDSQNADIYQALLVHIQALSKTNFEFRILLPSAEGSIPSYFEANGIAFDVICLPKGKGVFKIYDTMLYFRKLARYYRMFPFILVHASGKYADFISIFFKVRFNAVLVWQFWWVFSSRLERLSFRQLASVFCDHLIASSRSVAQQMDRTFRWREHLSVLSRGYSSQAIPQCSGTVVEGEEQLVLAIGGRFAPWRGHRVFLHTLEVLRRQHTNARAVIFYYGPEYSAYQDDIRALIGDLGLSSVVRLVPTTEPLTPGMLASEFTKEHVTFYVDTGVSVEPFDACVAEAVLKGIPVVTGGDANTLASEINLFCEDPQKTTETVARARAEFLERFSIDALETEFEKLYAKYFEREVA